MRIKKTLIKITFVHMSIVLKAKTEKKLRKKIGRPPKRAFLSFEIETVNKIFFILFFCFSFKYIRRTIVILISIFENTQKKVIDHQKHHFGN